ncbi:hypothetical protein PD280_02425 [Virgibacillus salarius]|uniref:hypothetical protein n=1 Tax=Virgibacillus salarius TaxID=447199 RepID=UPI0024924A2D|nr:hypothetical protein [Virgibacillus salarius]WBX80706.1 hypothetical protein PD280_02425 [Virgibacillus salarius]
MNTELKQLIQDFIVIPMAIKVYEQDKKLIAADFTMANLYISMIDAVIDRLRQVQIETKKKLYTKYHVDVKRVGNTSYKWLSRGESGIIEFTPQELREMTRDIMEKYMYGTKFKLKDGFVDQLRRLEKENPR